MVRMISRIVLGESEFTDISKCDHTFKVMQRPVIAFALQMTSAFTAHTKDGKTIVGNAGDYLIQNAIGDMTLCVESQFEQKFRKV